MSTPFQNRLVGTVIVAAVLIIFLPDILDGNKTEYHAEFEPIPKAPKSLQVNGDKSFPSKKLDVLIEKTPTVDEVAIDEAHSSDTESSYQGSNTKSQALVKNNPIRSSKPVDSSTRELPDKALPQTAWVVQLGSFRHDKNVKELVTKLNNSGYTAFTKPIKTKNGTLTKVFVGPELIKSKLEDKLPHLKNLTGMQGKIAHFSPAK